MDLSSIPPSPMNGIVNIVVEIPAGSRNKYEYCSEAGIMALDRVLHSSVRYLLIMVSSQIPLLKMELLLMQW